MEAKAPEDKVEIVNRKSLDNGPHGRTEVEVIAKAKSFLSCGVL